ncbi:hypothetical protein FOZ62_011068 [Perkinsus olseni]|uniref:Lysophosphatidic acid phosphatase type 6 n=1 Tax=Perkinsus olseni TaxID=32597 RepID=A0A7J6RXY9_PEROL|nr:hypothetical protein FOZ62_011068 [Perkinsus olseni]
MKELVLILLGAATAVDGEFSEGKPSYYCHSGLKWDDAPPREGGSSAQLERLLVFARHGARVPVRDNCWTYDSTKYNCTTRTFQGFIGSPSGRRSPGFTRIVGKRGVLTGGSCVLGQLVDSGIQMHLANGKQLGVAYSAALGLPDIPKEPEVMFRSTDVPRVYQSAEALAMGMFPKIVNVDPSKLEMRVPDSDKETMLPSDKTCPGLDDALNDFLDSSEAAERATRGSALRNFLGAITGHDFRTNDTRRMEGIYVPLLDCVTGHECPTVPSDPKVVPWGLDIDATYFKRVAMEAVYWSTHPYGATRKLQRLAYGPFIEDLLEDLREDRRRLSVYMGHDTGPAISVMDPLQLTWMDSGNRCASTWPPFGAMLIMEVYSDKNVRFIYNGRVASVEAIEECRGKSLCNYESLNEYLVTVVPSELECKGIP